MTVCTLAGMGLKLEDVGGERRIADLDQDRILADLREAGVPSRQRVWLRLQPFENFDRVLLARSDGGGTCQAALVAQYRLTDETPFLLVEALSGSSEPRDSSLIKRMLAFLMLRLDTFEKQPVAVLAHTRNPTLSRVMRDIATIIRGAGFYPEPKNGVVSLLTASLAHRMARIAEPNPRFAETRQAVHGAVVGSDMDGPMIAMLDLRGLDEDGLIEGARRIFRHRLPRSAHKALPLPAVAITSLSGNAYGVTDLHAD